MFNLEQAISEWRQKMSSAGVRSPVPLDELENHLRDEIDIREQTGANPQDAFESAVQQFGDAAFIKGEFAKTSIGNRLIQHRYLRLTCFIFAPVLLLLDIHTLLGAEIDSTQRACGLALISAIALYLAALPAIYQRMRRNKNRLLPLAIQTSYWLLMLWPCWALGYAFGIVKVQLGVVPDTVLWAAFAAAFATHLASMTYRKQSHPGAYAK
jgi:hypothetical protein